MPRRFTNKSDFENKERTSRYYARDCRICETIQAATYVEKESKKDKNSEMMMTIMLKKAKNQRTPQQAKSSKTWKYADGRMHIKNISPSVTLVQFQVHFTEAFAVKGDRN